MTDVGPRPHLWSDAAPLADSPLDEGSVSGVRVFRAVPTGPVSHSCQVETWSPVLADGQEAPRPSLVLAYQPELELLPESATAARVRFEHDGQTTRAQVPFPEGTQYFGLGESTGPFERTGRTQLLWNTDAWAYGEETAALYQSHPYVVALLPDGRAVGVLADTSWRGSVSCGVDGIELSFEGEPFDVHLLDAAHPADLSKGLAGLIGSIELPPLWALGYHQCRWSYETAEEVRALAAKFRELRIPCDAIWFDIDYMDRWRVFTWSQERFPDPAGLIDELGASGFHSVAIVDPGVAKGYDVCEEGLEGNHFVLQSDGKPAQGRVWPGVCHFPDFTREETRAWWAGRVKMLLDGTGLAGLWNDMNEPAVARTPTKTLPEDAQHRGLGGGPHLKFHNLYGKLMAEATLDGFRAARPDHRPFVLTRANHIAGSRFAATWTGDNQARWEDLAWAIPMVLNLGLSGQPFAGPDLGGFFGDPDAELFVRWFDLGAYLPFCRGHAHKESCRKEPWSFGPEACDHVRGALERRMRLLPYLYTVFEEAARTGLPVCRPLFFADPADARLRAVGDAFLLGEDLLVAPVLEPGQVERTVTLPRVPGGWFQMGLDGPRLLEEEVTVAAPLGTTPVFARAGSIIIEQPAVAHVGAIGRSDGGRETWHVYPDERGRAQTSRYEDDGEGAGYRNGAYRRSTIQAVVTEGVAQVDVSSEGELERPARAREIVLPGVM